MRTRIISAFPGTGKSTYHKEHSYTTLDSDSSLFSWLTISGSKVRNPNFPNNYIKHIKKGLGVYDFIFVSSHTEVRDALLDNSIFFYWICPDRSRKDEFIERYKFRGSDEGFVKLLDDKWDTWMDEFEKYPEFGMTKVNMILPNLSDELSHIIASENGETI